MATIKPCVIVSKTAKAGKNKVRISIAHNGQTRYILTNIVLNSNNEFKNGMVVKRPDAAILNTKIRGLLQRYQSALDELEYINGLTCPELVFLLLNGSKDKHRTLQSIFDEYVENARIKSTSAYSYKCYWKGVMDFFGKKFMIESLTYHHILGLDSHLRRRGLKQTSIRSMIILLKTIVSYATKCGYVQYKVSPFWGYTLPNTEVRQSWLSVEEIKKIRDLELVKPGEQLCRDMFMLSYYLGGINIADLIRINFNENREVLCYERKKTENKAKVNKYVEFQIPDEAQAIIERYKASSGYLRIHKREYSENFQDPRNNAFSYHFRKIEAATGIKSIVYYSARKSFAQHAFNLGVSTSVIDYILGHKLNSGGTSLYSYIYVTPEHATKAIRQVLDNLK